MLTRIDTTLSLITGPTVEPLDLDEVKKALRFTATSEDTLLDVWISAARQHFEEQTGRDCLTTVREYWLDACPYGSEIELPRPPLQAVLSVKYDDGDGAEQTFDAANYRVIAPAGAYAHRGRIVLASGASWPTTSGLAKSLRIQFTSGYGDAPGAVPELVKAALYFLVGHFHRNRAEVSDGQLMKLPLGAEAIFEAFKYSALPTLPPTRDAWLV